MIARLFPKGSEVSRDVETLAAHIYAFSIAGLNAMKKQAAVKNPTPRRRARTRLSL